jgi:hypothetical protein
MIVSSDNDGDDSYCHMREEGSEGGQPRLEVVV